MLTCLAFMNVQSGSNWEKQFGSGLYLVLIELICPVGIKIVELCNYKGLRTLLDLLWLLGGKVQVYSAQTLIEFILYRTRVWYRTHTESPFQCEVLYQITIWWVARYTTRIESPFQCEVVYRIIIWCIFQYAVPIKVYFSVWSCIELQFDGQLGT